MRSEFCGREIELKALQNAFHAINSRTPKPQLIALLAESGLGKTRLVQEFYSWLNKETGTGYWPESLGQLDDNLKINPDLSKCDNSKPLPFLWWGLRIADPSSRNNATTSAVIDGISILEPHLEPLHTLKKRKERLIAAGKSTGGVIFEFAAGAIPFVSSVKTLTSYAAEMAKHIRDTVAESKRKDVFKIHEQNQKTVATALIDDLTALFAENLDNDTPIVIVIDDAQFSSSDPDLVDIFMKLLDVGFENNWPMLMIVTHWESDWQAQKGDSSRKTIANTITKAWRRLPGDWEPLKLDRLGNLAPMLAKDLGGLSYDQRTALLSRADGNPRFLDEIIRHAKASARYFVGRDISNALTLEGMQTLLSKATNLQDLVRTRMKNAPLDVQRAVALGSVQGTTFLKDIVDEMSSKMGGDGASESLKEAEQRYAYIRGTDASLINFSQGVFYEVAREILDDEYDFEQVQAEVVSAIANRFNSELVWKKLTVAERFHLLLLAPSLLDAGAIQTDEFLSRVGNEVCSLLAKGMPSAAAEIAKVGLKHLSEYGIPFLKDAFKPVTVDILVIVEALIVTSRFVDARELVDGLITSLIDRQNHPEMGSMGYFKMELAKAYTKRGAISDAMKNYESAVIDFNAALSITLGIKSDIETRTEKPWNVNFENRLISSYYDCAEANKNVSNVKEAIAYYTDAINLAENLKNKVNDKWRADDEYMLITAYFNRAKLIGYCKDFLEARNDFTTAITRYKVLRTKFFQKWNSKLEMTYAELYFNRGYISAVAADFASALEDFKFAVEIASKQKTKDVEEGWTPSMQYKMSTYYEICGDILKKLDNAEQAFDYYASAVGHYNSAKEELGDTWTSEMETKLNGCVLKKGY